MNSKDININTMVSLNDGTEIPLFGFGMFRLDHGGVAENAMLIAIKHGYRLFDTAQFYGNEADVGRAVNKCGIDRQQLCIVSKVKDANHGYAETIASVKDSLTKLQLSYVDVFLIHSPNQGKNVETYKALIDLKSQGLIKSVGVSNFGITHLEGLKNAGLPTPSVNQIELHPWMKKQDLVDYCRNYNIAVMGYCPLARTMKHDDDDLIKIAKNHNKTVSQVMLRWGLDKHYITIPKSSNEQRIVENANIFDFNLTTDEHKILDSKPNDLNCSWDPTLTKWLG